MLETRNYLIEEYTKTVCPKCFENQEIRSRQVGVFLDGMLVSHGGKVWMRRCCPVHGEVESLYEEDLEIWRSRRDWSTPTLKVVPDRKDNYLPFPEGYCEGLPASHGQHTCILLLNVTQHCNYKCPTCFALALDPGVPMDLEVRPSLDEIERTVQVMLQREGGRLGVLMLSGGEPTVRKDLPELICRVLDLNITRVLINTNGRRIAKDDKFLDFLHQNRKRVEVYLQFDGVSPKPYIQLRGENVLEEKLLALDRLNQAGVYTTLVPTVKTGLNDHEIGKIIQLGLATPKCAGVAIQPMFGSGRVIEYDNLDRATPTGILKTLEKQTSGLVKAEDFIPLPCSHRDCCDISYFIKTKKGKWRSLPSLIGREEIKYWIHLVANSISFESVSGSIKEMLKLGTLQRIFSEQQKTSALGLAKDIFAACGCVPGIGEVLETFWNKGESTCNQEEKIAESTFRITVKMFMDAHTFHEHRIRQCCVHTGTFEDDPRRYSFCWRWLFDDATDFPDRKKNPLTLLRSL